MPDILQTAAFILEQTGPISPTKLQKLCYYAQAWSLAWTGRELFPEEFEPWKSGPISPVLFHSTQHQKKIEPKDFPCDPSLFDSSQQDILRQICSYYGPMDSISLIMLSCRDTPWKSAFPNKSVISKQSIREYYKYQNNRFSA